ncbi:hypothetical protein FIBSPDRAFT_915308 [Athelia psychrophila]|uniref:Uncharacterized protein n=1 Tax=Athelia psychrophila TaxID=1759441 RepID=A0A167U026_9AGAM|nr:hypothetical protein FIBSPDRAFT_915308 [Fibularhizoctonia sp. CBS 109695]
MLPVTDDEGRVVVSMCAGPADPTWMPACTAAVEHIQAARDRIHTSAVNWLHRRGDFLAMAHGVLYGGSQKRPANLKHTAGNEAVFKWLFSQPEMIRIAWHGSSALAFWAPDLYRYYGEHLRPLFEANPELHCNFRNSVYPCATVNFGPVTCTFDHVDPANLPFGLCAVTALGDFDHTRGGHLVLWDLKLIIEFPAGSTALLPSAVLRHSNIATQPGETRNSGMQPTAAYMESLSREDWEAEMERSAARWQEGVRLYSTLTSLQQPADLN